MSVPILVYNEHQELLGLWSGGVDTGDSPYFEFVVSSGDGSRPEFQSVRFIWHVIEREGCPGDVIPVLEVSHRDYEIIRNHHRGEWLDLQPRRLQGTRFYRL